MFNQIQYFEKYVINRPYKQVCLVQSEVSTADCILEKNMVYQIQNSWCEESAQLSVSRTREERQALDSTDGQEHKNLSLRLVLKIKRRNHYCLENWDLKLG